MASGFSIQKDTTDILLIGKTGNGKSASGNSILRKPGAFAESSSVQSVTSDVQYDFTVFDDRVLKVVDGPGVGDTRMNDEEALNLVLNSLEYAIMANPSGYHAFIIVLRYGDRYTEEDVQTMRILKHIFGQDFVKKFCILLLSCGDNFENCEEETGMNFEQWCQSQKGVFRELMNECNNRVVLFNNKTKNETQKLHQLTRLMQLVDRLQGVRYTDKHFADAQQLRERLMVESKEKRIREETLKDMVILLREFEHIQTLDVQDEPLRRLKSKAEELLNSVKEQDKGTGALKYALQAASAILAQVNGQIEKCRVIGSAREEAAKREKEMMEEFERVQMKQQKEFNRQMEEETRRRELKMEERKKELQRKQQKEIEETQRLYQEQMQKLREETALKDEEVRRREEQEFEEKVRRDEEAAERRRQEEKEQLERRIREQREQDERERRKQEEEQRLIVSKKKDEFFNNMQVNIRKEMDEREAELDREIAMYQDQAQAMYRNTRKQDESVFMRLVRGVGIVAHGIAQVAEPVYRILSQYKNVKF